MATTKLIRRRFHAATAAAAVVAAVIAVAPLMAGDPDPPATGTAYLNQSEGGGVHDQGHQAASPQAKAEARADAKACTTAPDGTPFCPEPPPSAAQITVAARSAGELGPEESSQPDGMWGPLLHIPTTAIHAIVLPTGKVLFISQPKWPAETENDGGNAHVWDPVTNTFTAVPPPVVTWPTGPDRPANIWCGGQALLADGRVLVVGGNLAYPVNNGNGAGNGFKGARWVVTFDPWTETWTRYQDMPHGRWYPTLTELPDGRVLILGGWDETGGTDDGGADQPPAMHDNQDVEVFDPATPAGGKATSVVSELPPGGPGQPSPWPNHETIGLYPHTFVLPSTTTLGAGGYMVLVAGPGKYDSAVIDTRTWVWTDVVDKPDTGQARLSQERSWGTAWLAPGGVDGGTRVVMLSGSDAGGAAPGAGTAPAPVRTAEVLDLNAPDAGWQLGAAPPLDTGRAHFNTTLLPDGGIFTNGGGYGRKLGSMYADPVYQAELLRPGANAWEAVGSEADARTYHSTAVLLPDGRVASAGDDRDTASAISPDHLAVANRTAQLWSPPYLFAGPRPVVTFAPSEIGYGTTFRVAVQGDPSQITSATLMRPTAVTHSVNMSGGAIRLGVSAQADGLTLTTPRDASVAPPGWYMLFLLDGEGVPSVASWVRVAGDAPVAPALPVAPAPVPTTPVPPVGEPAPYRVRTLAASLSGRGPRLVLALRLKATEASSARVAVLRGRRAVLARTVPLRAGRLATPRIAVGRSALHGARTVTIRFRITHGGRVTTAERTLRVPAAR
ncbi:MAG TPA: galactose oxidase-like domain-containing protein [Miltoncostaea sp.]|nr:galactose oxidase-like domain-containing protein [Miltoncostaea sp.]